MNTQPTRSRRLTQPSPSGLMTGAATARYLGIDISTFNRWREQDPSLEGLARRMPGGHPYWLLDEIDSWIRNRCSRGVAAGSDSEIGAA